MRGPKPLPANLRALRGNPGKRRITRESRPGPLDPAVPAELIDPVARAEWERVAPGLCEAGQVTMADRAVLVGYCVMWAQWLALAAAGRGDAANRAFTLMLKAATELGMTPATRPRVHVSPPAVAPGRTWADVLP